jgi:hypothetical protein
MKGRDRFGFFLRLLDLFAASFLTPFASDFVPVWY